MDRTGPSLDRPARPQTPSASRIRLVAGLGAAWLVVIAVVTAVLALGDPASTPSQLLSSIAVLSAITFALVSCIRAARRRTAPSQPGRLNS